MTTPSEVPDPKKILAIYSVILLAFFTLLGVSTYYYSEIVRLQLQLMIYTACAGGIGGTIYNIYTFTSNPSDKQWFLWYSLYPIMAIFFGAFSYILVAGGVLVLSGQENNAQIQEFMAQTILFYMGIAFIAGFSTPQFLTKLKELAEAIFAKAPESPP
jgi:hypothetical protein